ncbi:MAG: hypothetical protein JWR08_901 [Enterovirga sp.]|jgi:hypothetical protein|nr:hypothetical protein [Enterovirga sp.]
MRIALALLVLASSPAPAQDIETAQTLPTRRPKAFSAFRAVLPAGFEADDWIHALDGTSEPLRTIRLEGRQYLLGFSCKPHDCGPNALAFLAAADGSRAVVMVKSDERTRGVVEVYGRSSGRERLLLKDHLAIPR